MGDASADTPTIVDGFLISMEMGERFLVDCSEAAKTKWINSRQRSIARGTEQKAVYIRFLICLRSLRALSVARTRFCSVSRDPDELPEEDDPESEPEKDDSEESINIYYYYYFIDGAYLQLPESEELELRRRRRNLSNFLGAGDSFFRLEAGLCAPPPPARFSSAARLYDGETLPTV